MQNRYNLYNFEAPFKNYLLAGNCSKATLKNYLSDIRHFLGWLYASSTHEIDKTGITTAEIAQSIITDISIENYKKYLLENKIPAKTINRRLSTIRRFCAFCVSQGWLSSNPSVHISNLDNTLSVSTQQTIEELIIAFGQDNKKESDVLNLKKNVIELQSFLHYIFK